MISSAKDEKIEKPNEDIVTGVDESPQSPAENNNNNMAKLTSTSVSNSHIDLEFYHGLLPREDIVHLLGRHGDFLLRTTEMTSGADRQVCLSVKTGNEIKHFLLAPTTTGKFAVEIGREFATVADLVEHYIRSKEFFSKICQLLNPIGRQDWELRHNQVVLNKQLGEGAFGAVFAGVLLMRRDNMEIDVAVKQTKCGMANKEKIEELMHEARLMRHLQHPNVVRFFGVAAEREPLMIVMELVQMGAYMSVMERLDICLEGALGLEYLHQNGILHRDIAARNCLYATSKRLKLTDFGLSEKAEYIKLDPNCRLPFRSLAPEAFSSMIYNRFCDLWAYGVLIWEVFNNGMEPYAAWAGVQVKTQLLTGFRLPMPAWAPDAVKECVNIVWSSNPESRKSIEFIARQLEQETTDSERHRQSLSTIKTAALKEVDDAIRVHQAKTEIDQVDDDDAEQKKQDHQDESTQIKQVCRTSIDLEAEITSNILFCQAECRLVYQKITANTGRYRCSC